MSNKRLRSPDAPRASGSRSPASPQPPQPYGASSHDGGHGAYGLDAAHSMAIEALAHQHSADADAEAGRAKKKKKAVSCQSCRRRKLKCDRGWPCGACKDRGEAELCEWEGGTRPQSTSGRDALHAAPAVLSRLDHIEGQLSLIASHLGLSSHAASQARSVGPQSLFALSASPPDRVYVLEQSLALLPPPESLRKLAQYFLENFAWCIFELSVIDWWHVRLPRIEELRRSLPDDDHSGQTSVLHRMSREDVDQALRDTALALAIVGIAVLFVPERSVALAGLPRGADSTSRHVFFFEAAQAAIDATLPLDLPSFEALQIYMLQLFGLITSCGVHWGGIGLQLAAVTHMMYALGLDREPTIDTPHAEASMRIAFFTQICIWTWQNGQWLGSRVLLREEPIKHPYLFGEPGSSPWHDLVQEHGELISIENKSRLRAACFSQRAMCRDSMTAADAGIETDRIFGQVMSFRASLPDSLSEEVSMLQTTEGMSARSLNTLLDLIELNLFRPYYLDSWAEGGRRDARDVCYSAAMRLLSRFHRHLESNAPGILKAAALADVEGLESLFKGKREVAARLWFWTHASVNALFLLQHHLEQMDLHMVELGPDAPAERAHVAETCALSRRLLVALSLCSQPARTVLAQLQNEGPHGIGKPLHVPAAAAGFGPGRVHRSAPLELLAGVSSHARTSAYRHSTAGDAGPGASDHGLHAPPMSALPEPAAHGTAFDVDGIFHSLFGTSDAPHLANPLAYASRHGGGGEVGLPVHVAAEAAAFAAAFQQSTHASSSAVNHHLSQAASAEGDRGQPDGYQYQAPR